MMAKPNSTVAQFNIFRDDPHIFCMGLWTASNLQFVEKQIKRLHWPKKSHLIIDASNIIQMDSSGAWLLYKTIKTINSLNTTVELKNFSDQQQHLLDQLTPHADSIADVPPRPKWPWLARLGKTAINRTNQLVDYFSFIGELLFDALHTLSHPSRLPWRQLFSILETAGFQALPIIALLSFMIGVVLTYQMGLQLEEYGANIFIVDLLGFSVLREFGVLLTAIIVAGRTGSAFAAQLGTMVINEEIDALRTMGVPPAKLLILPKILGLVIVMPLLTIWADIFGILGGIIMSKISLNLSAADFLTRFPKQVGLSSLMIGLGKAPVFALLISSIGCFQGIRVRGGADSVGSHTTTSVVQSIFFILVVDAAFSIIFSKLNI